MDVAHAHAGGSGKSDAGIVEHLEARLDGLLAPISGDVLSFGIAIRMCENGFEERAGPLSQQTDRTDVIAIGREFENDIALVACASFQRVKACEMEERRFVSWR